MKGLRPNWISLKIIDVNHFKVKLKECGVGLWWNIIYGKLLLKWVFDKFHEMKDLVLVYVLLKMG